MSTARPTGGGPPPTGPAPAAPRGPRRAPPPRARRAPPPPRSPARVPPGALSPPACSLVPGRDRLAVTVEMEFDGHQMRKAAFYRSVIRSDKRLSYPDVDAIIG